jgi:hypothetical protein
MKVASLFLAFFLLIFLVLILQPTQFQAMNVDIKLYEQTGFVNIPMLYTTQITECKVEQVCDKRCKVNLFGLCLWWENYNCRNELKCNNGISFNPLPTKQEVTPYNPNPNQNPYQQNGQNYDSVQPSTIKNPSNSYQPTRTEEYFWQKVCMGETIQNRYIKGTALLVERKFKKVCYDGSCNIYPTDEIRNKQDCTLQTKVCVNNECVRYPLELQVKTILKSIEQLLGR